MQNDSDTVILTVHFSIFCSTDIIMEPMVIEVHGVPHIPPDDWMVDQLKIHFLERRNSGGDVLTVIYPTSTPGQAYVVFESAKGMDTHSELGTLFREQCLKPLAYHLFFCC